MLIPKNVFKIKSQSWNWLDMLSFKLGWEPTPNSNLECNWNQTQKEGQFQIDLKTKIGLEY